MLSASLNKTFPSFLYGPTERRRHVAGMRRESRLLLQPEEHMNDVDGTVFALYGGPVYPPRAHPAPFKGAVLTKQNVCCSS